MPGRFSFFFMAALPLGHIASALVPAEPTITAPAVLPKRQNQDNFIGWLEYENTWYSETCSPGLTWYQDSKYAQCCEASLASCVAPTACVSGTLIYTLPALLTTTRIACTDNYGTASFSICNTAFIFENTADSNPKTDIVCGASSLNWSYYRKLPSSATEVVSSNAVSVPQIKSTAIIASSALPQPKKEGSKAWIAGAVVGPILGLALIGAAVFFILRRRKNKKTTITPQQGGASMAQASPSHPPAGPGGYTETKPQFTPQSQPYGQPYAQPAPQDQYVQQGAYAAQQGYAAAPMSPAPQYDGPSQYNAPGSPPSQYSAPSSPPPQQGYYGQPDVKHAYSGAPQGGAFELGDGSNGIASAAPVSPAAELGGASPQHATQGQYGHTELPTTHR